MTACALLRRHEPIVALDSRERYLPLCARAWTDAPGHELRRADGTVIADNRGALPRLQLSFLGPDRYRDGTPVQPGDAIVSPGRGYRAKAQALQRDPATRGWVYGRARRGSDGRWWLQYRWFYFFNDYRIGGVVPVGIHEGDWEMIQLRLDAEDRGPDLALYTQHRTAQVRPWTAVETVGDRPVVYVARGAHGCYFTPGVRFTGAWFDHADGRRREPATTLEVVGDGPEHDWIRWPGHWGGSRPRRGPLGALDASSPAGPGAAVHLRWTDPAVLLTRVRG